MHPQKAAEKVAGFHEAANTILNTLDAHIAILDARGVITTVNDAWTRFAGKNLGRLSALSEGCNYLEVCTKASAEGDEYALRASAGIESVIKKKAAVFEMEYPCHAPDEERWFLLRAIPLADGSDRITVTHLDISDRKRAEQRLEEREKRLEDITSNIPGIVYQFVRHPDGSFSAPYFSRTAYELTGVSPEQLEADPNLMFRLLHPDDVEATFRRIDESARSLSHYSVDNRLKTKSGEYRWFHVESTPRLLDDGAILWNGVAADITERKATEEALKNEAVRRRMLMEHSRDGIVVLDKNGKVYEANKSYADSLGYTMEEVLDLHVWDWDDQWNREELMEKIRTIDETGDRFETRHRRKDGSYLDVEISTNSAICEGQKLVFCVCRDITDRKRTEQALRESEERYRLLFQNLTAGFVLHEIILGEDGRPRDYRFLEVNPAFERLTGLKADDLIGRTVLEALPDTEPYWIETYGRVAMTGESFHFENRHGESNKYYEVRAYQQEPGRFAVLFQDITERKRMEETLRVVAESSVATGEDFFRLLVRQLALSQGTRYALIAKIDQNDPATAHTVAMWNGGEYAENFSYRIEDTPCERVRSQGSRFFPRDMRNLFPRDQMLARMGVESYWGAPLIDSNGKVIGILAVMDVEPMEEKSESFSLLKIFSARAAAEMEREMVAQALRESEEKFRLTFSTSPDAININRVEDGFYVDINEGFTSLTGFTRDDAIGNTSLEIKIWNDERDRQELVRGLKEKGYYENLEAQFRRKDGTLTTALVSARVISLGGVPHIISITRDISERKRAEEALKESEERFKILSERSPFGMSLIDAKGRYEYVNPAFVKMFGYQPDEIRTGEDWFRCAYPDAQYRREVIRSWMDDLERFGGRGERPRKYEVTCKDGTRKTIQFRSVTISRGRQFVIYEDITRQRKLADQLRQAQKMEAVGTLAGGISHDFNNLLQVIEGYTQLLLLNKSGDDPEYQSLEAIQEACDRAAQLVRQLLLFSRKGATERKPLDINHEVEQARKILERTIPKMIDIEVHSGSRLWTVEADPVQIEQILLNLGSNAADAMPDGGRLIIETENAYLGEDFAIRHWEAEPGNYVLITVSDTGCGMDEETIKHIFEPFYTTKGIGKGTGLGLASVYGIVKSHGGHITCSSEPGRGAAFKIYLAAAEQKEACKENAVKESVLTGGRETILLVDDEDSVRDVAFHALQRFGYAVLTAPSGEEALDVYVKRQNEIDLVIMDIGMPGMGGSKCLREIMRINPAAKVVIASGYSFNKQVKDIWEAGAAGFIGKPYRLADFLNEIRTILDKKD